MHSFITPQWHAPACVKAFTTTRLGGHSAAPFDSLNLGMNTGDDLNVVQQNRDELSSILQLPHEPMWLTQVHGTDVVTPEQWQQGIEADASVAFISDSGTMSPVCAVLTADCLPVLFCDQKGSVVAAAHAGWRGLLNGVLENTIIAMGVPAQTIMAWFGPAISQSFFEVGSEVRDAFLAIDSGADCAFIEGDSDRWFADIYHLARRRLQWCGVTQISGGELCSYRQSDLFYSYRRNQQSSGRMASLILIAEQ